MDALALLSKEQISDLCEAIDKEGIAVWPDAISAKLMREARAFVGEQLVKNDHQYFSLRGDQWLTTSPLRALGESCSLRHTVTVLGNHFMKGKPVEMNMAASMRVLTGELGRCHSDRYHYDSYVVTVLVPLLIPDEPGEPHGDLVLFPNLRRIKRNALLNIGEKLLVENRLACLIWRMVAGQHLLGARVIKMEPGNLYFFCGMRSLHANRPCSLDRVRSTALFHFGDPHVGGLLKRLSGVHHRLKQQRIARRNKA